MTKKFIYILALGVPLVTICGFINHSLALTVFLIYNAACVLFLFADRIISPDIKDFVIERDTEDKLYFKTENEVRFTVRNLYHKPVRLQIRDEIPDWHFELVSEENALKTIDPGQETEFSYTVIPTKRGSFIFENIYVAQTGVLGLCKKQYKVPFSRDFKVYPNLQNLSKYRLIVSKHRLLSMGSQRINQRGQGSEFESLREYVEGDDYRKINWKVTARENKLIVNQYEAEKNQPVFILLDTGRSMSYSVNGYKKLDYAINAALILSDIVNQKGDKSGLIVFNTDVTAYIPAGKGDTHRNQFMETLYHTYDTLHTSDYHGAFFEHLSRQKRRSIVFIFTDFETEGEMKDLMQSIGIIRRQHIPVIVFMKNESLEKMAETEDKKTMGIYRQAMAEDLLANRRKIIKTLNQKGILCIESEAEKFAIDAVNQYLLVRERFSR